MTAIADMAELGFGGAPIGNLYKEVSDADAESALKTAWDNGVRYFDTAPHYGFGLSEKRLGEFLKGCARQSYRLSTKAGRLLKPILAESAGDMRHGFANACAYEPYFDYSYDGVMASFEGSLNRLNVSSVDILYIHDLGEATHGQSHDSHWRSFLKGGLKAMQALQAQGVVGKLGLGVNEVDICLQAIKEAEGIECFLLAGRYTLLEQGALDAFLPECEKRGYEVCIGGPFNSGILAAADDEEANYNYMPAPGPVREKVRLIRAIAAEHDVELQAAALAFPAFHPCVSAVVAGFANASEVEQAIVRSVAQIPLSFWRSLREAGLISSLAPAPDLARAA